MRHDSTDQLKWGKVMICGGINWATNGLKDRPPQAAYLDILGPSSLRSLCNIDAVKAVTGPASNFAVILDRFGAAYLIGKFPAPYGVAGLIDAKEAVKLSPRLVGSEFPQAKFITGACGRHTCFLVDDQGEVWGCGNNTAGELGLPICKTVNEFTRINGPWTKDAEKVVAVTAGDMFSLFLTDAGYVYSAGYGQFGQLGHGFTGEKIIKGNKLSFHMETPPRLIRALQGKKITQIASGNNHSLALDADGYVYAWGHAGYSRLGLDDTKDRLVPTLVAKFAGKLPRDRAKAIYCGMTSSVIIEQTGRFFMAGKWKISGDGGVGQPYTTFKRIQDISIVDKVALGGCTHLVTCADADDEPGSTMTLGFGQGVLYGELGFGQNRPLGAALPTRVTDLDGCEVLDIGAATFFTIFIVRPKPPDTDATCNLPVWPTPEDVASAGLCVICFSKRDEALDPVVCEKCEEEFHLDCLEPPLDDYPEGNFFCPECALEGEGGLDQPFRSSKTWMRATKLGWQKRQKAAVPRASIGLSSSVIGVQRPAESKEGREGSVLSRSSSSRASKKSKN